MGRREWRPVLDCRELVEHRLGKRFGVSLDDDKILHSYQHDILGRGRLLPHFAWQGRMRHRERRSCRPSGYQACLACSTPARRRDGRGRRRILLNVHYINLALFSLFHGPICTEIYCVTSIVCLSKCNFCLLNLPLLTRRTFRLSEAH